ncbi:MAG: hypothetical protein WCO00_07390 [Rhodospirillaceae bacterium]
MVALRKHAAADGTAESLVPFAGRARRPTVALEAVQRDGAVLMETRLEVRSHLDVVKSRLDLLITHLVRPAK